MHVHDQPLRLLTRTSLAGAVVVLALAVLLATHSTPLWLIAALAICGVVAWLPWMGLLLLPPAVAFGSLSTFQLSSLHVGPTDALVAGLALAGIARLSREPARIRILLAGAGRRAATVWRTQRVHAVVALSLLCYLAVVCLSGLWAIQRTATAKEAIKWGEVLVVATCAFLLVDSTRRLRQLIWVMILTGALEALVGLGQWAADGGNLATGGQIRVFGTFAQPNPFAAYMNLALPLAVALLLFSRDVRERWVAGGAAIVLAAAEYLAHSRGAALALLGALVVILAIGLRKERVVAVAAAVLVSLAALAWMAHLIPARIVNAITTQFHVAGSTVCGQVNARDFSTVERIAHWVAGLRMFAAHPVVGVGAGNYPAAYPRFACADWPEPLGHAHNYYINTGAELGVVGLIAFLALVGCVLYLGWRASHQPSKLTTEKSMADGVETRRVIAIGLLAILVGVTIHNLTDDLFVHAMELQMALCAGCLFRLDGLLPRER